MRRLENVSSASALEAGALGYIPKSVPAAESFEALFEESLTRQEMRIGEVITAEVVRLDSNFVVVNAGLKSESFIPLEEFKTDRRIGGGVLAEGCPCNADEQGEARERFHRVNDSRG